MDGVTVSKSIDKIRDTDVPAPWPAECAECRVILRNREEAEAHRVVTEHDIVVVPETEHDRAMLSGVVSEWKCADCDEHFVTRAEAGEHREVFGHVVLGIVDARAVN
jgi:hypothetical protein